MACLVALAVVTSVKAVQSGIQAHKDFHSDLPIEPRYHSDGRLKKPNPIYGLVMKVETKVAARKGIQRGDEATIATKSQVRVALSRQIVCCMLRGCWALDRATAVSEELDREERISEQRCRRGRCSCELLDHVTLHNG